MANLHLPFINDENLYAIVKPLVTLIEKTAEEEAKSMNRNTIDPFSALFDAAKQNITLTDWLNQEKSRQVQKTLQNAIGIFHQEILGAMPQWQSLPVGGIIDVKNDNKKIIAEIKNKHNTTNSSSAEALYDHLYGVLNNSYKGYTAYHVQIIPKSRNVYDKPYTPSARPSNKSIRVIDGKSFYAMASGYNDALKMLYIVLPKVIGDILQRSTDNVTKDRLFIELFERAYS
jgi:hypothetical protein